METTKSSYHWTGSGLFRATYNSSYGGELYGIYLILQFLNIMWPNHLCPQGCILIKCDNLSGINDCSKRDLKLSQSKKFLSLLRAIRKLKQDLRDRNLLILFRNIKGHQDDKTKYHKLNRWAQMNVLVDLLAKQRLQNQIIQNKEIAHSLFYGEGWSCWLGDTKIDDLVHQDIKQGIYKRRAR